MSIFDYQRLFTPFLLYYTTVFVHHVL